MSIVNEKLIDTILFDVGSTFTKATAMDNVAGELVWLARAQAPTTVKDINRGLGAALDGLAAALNAKTITARNVQATSSAAGGLRMVAMGFMPRVTAKAAKEVAMNAGARVLEVMSFEDKPENKLEMLCEIRPDIILLAGGTDGGNQASLLEDARLIVDSKVNAVVVLAGNVSIQPQVEAILQQAGIRTIRVANVMPTIHSLNVKPAREAIHEQFIHQITEAKGLGKLMERLTVKKVIPTPGAVLLATELMAKGTREEKGIGNLAVVDLGGATTDIHSVLPYLEELSIEEKGLIVTNEKQLSYRTVEGNLGLRVSARGILEAAGEKAILARAGLEGESLEKSLHGYAAQLEANPEYLAMSNQDKLFDRAMAGAAVEIAFKRHAGYIAQSFDPVMGIVPGTPVGRDLRRIKAVIAVGGIFTSLSTDEAAAIIRDAVHNPGISLLPKENIRVIIDKTYLLYAIGLLAEYRPTQALRLAKRHFGLAD
ncbi:hypothetical protein SPACI_025200 [Sporomusa acidovorans DSM 3132]|uniref:MutL protein n=2 Tax=Sporomusa TaxID=2375 RepID=A0ABZ3J2W7_SPOA4|nr:hypothetical protein SPACI_23620 [Sporomusa acidovorans DSM 3132]SDD48911.1 conserved hypothetical protein [Sporomusa acidovorans]